MEDTLSHITSQRGANMNRVESSPRFAVSIILMASFLSMTAFFAYRGETYLLFGSSLLCWLSYLGAHKSAEGKLIDGKEVVKDSDEDMTPRNSVEYVGSVLGSNILIGGIGFGALGLRRGSMILLFKGSIFFILGYILAHLSTTGKPL